MMSVWNTRWRGKVPAIVSLSVALRKISCLPNEPWVHTQSEKYMRSTLKNNHEKAQGSCALSPWSLAGAAIFNYISFPLCNFWLDWFDVTLYVYSQGSTGSRFFQPHQYFLWYCEWRRGKVIYSGSREIEGSEPGNWEIEPGIALQPSRILCWKRILIGEYSQTLVVRRNLPQKIRGEGRSNSTAYPRIRVSAYPLTHTLQKFGGRGGRTSLRIRVSTHPHTPKIRGEGRSNFTAYPRIHSPTHSKNSGGGAVELQCVSAYPLTHTLQKFGGRGGRTSLRIGVSTHQHTPWRKKYEGLSFIVFGRKL